MVAGVREFFRTSAGKSLAVALSIVALVVFFFSVRSNLGDSEAAANSKNRLFICAATGETFYKELEIGLQIPVESPHSGKPTGYEAELCYWTKDGQIKHDPTPVLLNGHAGKAEPTFCPDCGRRVTPLNPAPSAGQRPPPTQAEWAGRGNRAAAAGAPAGER